MLDLWGGGKQDVCVKTDLLREYNVLYESLILLLVCVVVTLSFNAKGPSIIVDIFLYDNSYRKMGGGG